MDGEWRASNSSWSRFPPSTLPQELQNYFTLWIKIPFSLCHHIVQRPVKKWGRVLVILKFISACILFTILAQKCWTIYKKWAELPFAIQTKKHIFSVLWRIISWLWSGHHEWHWLFFFHKTNTGSWMTGMSKNQQIYIQECQIETIILNHVHSLLSVITSVLNAYRLMQS